MKMKLVKLLLLPILAGAAALSAQTAPAAETKTAEVAKNIVAEKTADAPRDVYDKVIKAFGDLKYRIPGSSQYYKAVDAMEQILKDVNVDVKRQQYPTLVPATVEKIYTADGKLVAVQYVIDGTPGAEADKAAEAVKNHFLVDSAARTPLIDIYDAALYAEFNAWNELAAEEKQKAGNKFTVVGNKFTVDVKDGKKDIKIYPLAPNNVALVTTGETAIENAPVVYIPSEKLSDAYGKVAGKILLLDWGEYKYPKALFTEGARAIIFVGKDNTTQWDVAKNLSQYNIQFPYFYMDRKTAVENGLLEGEHKATLQLHTQWKQVTGINLWAVIPSKEPKQLNKDIDQPEAVVLGARLDSFGAVPGKVSGDRQVANLALFAQNAALLKEKELDRAVFLVVYGSSFNAYDSLRFFFYPIHKQIKNKVEPLITDYSAGFQEELADNQKKLDILSELNPVIVPEESVNYLKISMVSIAILILVIGCIPAAYGLRDRKKVPGIIGSAVAVVGLAFLIVICSTSVFDVVVSEEEKSDTAADCAKSEAELHKLETELMPKIAVLNALRSQINAVKAGIECEKDAAVKEKLSASLEDLEQKLLAATDGVQELAQKYNNEFEKYDKLRMGAEDDMRFQVRMLVRDAVIERYNEINYELADINTKIRRSKNSDDPVNADAKLTADEIKALVARRIELDAEKVRVADMRRAVNERKIGSREKKSGAVDVAACEERLLLKKFADQVKQDIEGRKTELAVGITMADDWIEIADAARVRIPWAEGNPERTYLFVGAYFFDFARDDMPFILATRGYEGAHSYDELDIAAYSKYFVALYDLLKDMKLMKSQAPYFQEPTQGERFVPDILTSKSLVYLPSAATLPAQISSFTMRSLPGDYDYDEIPAAADEKLKRNYRLTGLIPVMDEFLTKVIQAKELSMRSSLQDSRLFDDLLNYYYKNGTAHGRLYSYLSPDGKEISGPAAGSFAIVQQNEYDRIPPVCGFSLGAFGLINKNGYTTMPLLTSGGRWGKGDMKIGGAAMGFDEFGHTSHINTTADYFKLFRCYGGPHVYEYAPLTSNFAGSLSLVNGFTDASFKNFRTYARVATGDGYAYADTDMKAKIYFFNETFMLGGTKEDPAGKGIRIDRQSLLNLNVSRIAIDNTILLNRQRIDKLHNRQMYDDVVEGYQDKAEQHQKEAEEALRNGDLNKARAHEVFGQTLAVQAYRPLRDTINDLVQSVLILLILTIPFAFALERLIIGATSIYKQMMWILIFFIGTFVLLYFTHPAFALSQTPIIIFIAFFIIVMSVVVIYIVMNRFKSELMVLQGLDTSAHRVNSGNSMFLAAIMIGVSSMRNRPVKTFLTILTVVLLTFTIISFASFSSTEKVRPVYMGDGSGEVRIESFLPQHVDLLNPVCQAVKELYEDDYNVYFRSASYNSPFYINPTYPVQTNMIYNPEVKGENGEQRTLALEAVVGFEWNERNDSVKLKSLMPALDPEIRKNLSEEDLACPGVYLSATTAKLLQLEPGSMFYLRNKKVRLDGVFDPAELESFTYLDGGKAVPPNFEATARAEETGAFAVFNRAYLDASNFIWSSPDLTMLTDYQTACEINGFINGVVLYPREGKTPDVMNDATEIAEVTFGIVYSKTVNGVNRHFMAPVFSASGISNLIVPLLLGALIILSSLLGSITDREREIFTFSALGLSPKDVSTLFFAESGVYAVIGGLGGYLLSQIVNALLRFLVSNGILPDAPAMNYSSMTTVYTILIVMILVMLSTVYPAFKAGNVASPDVARKWKMPAPEGDRLCFQFPFTVSRVDFGGILVFISEHFANHADSSLGSFAASNIRITHGESDLTDGYMLSVNLTLAPFDLGVAEELDMYSAPSEIEGVDVVTVNIIRKDGSKGAWLRGNRRFVDEVRNQFLLWRSLPVETVMHYRNLAEQKLQGEKA